MGYGHLRAAHALADAAGVPVLEADGPDVASEDERRMWARSRALYEALSRSAGGGVMRPVSRFALARITAIPRMTRAGGLSERTAAVRYLARLMEKGLCSGAVARARALGAPLLTTFYAPAIAADLAGHGPVVCVVTDSDVNRVWAPEHPAGTRIRYAVPGHRAARRLRAFGVPADLVHVTGFPLPLELVGDAGADVLQRNLASRLVRLDPRGAFRKGAAADARRAMDDADPEAARRPPLVVFAVGGAGAQVELACALPDALSEEIREGRLRLALVAGTREDTAERCLAAVEAAGLLDHMGPAGPIDVVRSPSFTGYLEQLSVVLAGADVLWTKPSEMTFFAGLGLPLLLAPSLGKHEEHNARTVLRRGAALRAGSARHAARWLPGLLSEGRLAAAAWAGWRRLPSHGTRRILSLVAGESG